MTPGCQQTGYAKTRVWLYICFVEPEVSQEPQASYMPKASHYKDDATVVAKAVFNHQHSDRSLQQCQMDAIHEQESLKDMT